MSVLALDIGSSRIKALLADWDGRLIEVRSTGTPTQSLEPGERSYPVDAVHDAVEGLIAGLASAHREEAIDTLVFSCLGTAMAPLDGEDWPLGPALAPVDARPQRAPWSLDGLGIDAGELYERTGSDAAVPSFLLHALWWQEAHPEVMERVHRFRSLRGYTLARLCGVDVEDRAWASRTMLADLETDAWSPEILHAAGLSEGLLPAIDAPTATFPLEDAAVERLGLAPGAVAVLGAMDNGCSFFGAAGPDRSGLVDIVGTYEHMAGAAGLAEVRTVAREAGAIVHGYVLPGQYIAMTRVPIGELLGRAAAGHGGGLDSLLDGISAVPQGPPIDLDPSAIDGALREGLPRHQILQGLLEAATAVLVRFADAWATRGLADDPVAIVGGGAGHEAVLQLKASLLGRSLVKLTSDEGAGLGALRLAAMAIRGATADEACRLFGNPITRTVQPHPVASTTLSERATMSEGATNR